MDWELGACFFTPLPAGSGRPAPVVRLAAHPPQQGESSMETLRPKARTWLAASPWGRMRHPSGACEPRRNKAPSALAVSAAKQRACPSQEAGQTGGLGSHRRAWGQRIVASQPLRGAARCHSARGRLGKRISKASGPQARTRPASGTGDARRGKAAADPPLKGFYMCFKYTYIFY